MLRRKAEPRRSFRAGSWKRGNQPETAVFPFFGCLRKKICGKCNLLPSQNIYMVQLQNERDFRYLAGKGKDRWNWKFW